MKFNYDDTDTDPAVILSVADAIRSSGRLAPLTDQQKLDHRIQQEIWREEQAWREEQRRAERERQEQEREAIARHEAAVALAEANRQARLEQQKRNKERQRESEMLNLRVQTAQARGWMESVENSARVGQYLRQRQAIMDELDAIVNPPAPRPAPAEPEVVYVEQPAENTGLLPKLDYPKLRSWWFD